jgi:hypothetical protein
LEAGYPVTAADGYPVTAGGLGLCRLGLAKAGQEAPVTVFEDARGPNVRVLRQAQRRLAPAELEALIAEYEAGARVCELAKVYDLHRTTDLGGPVAAGPPPGDGAATQLAAHPRHRSRGCADGCPCTGHSGVMSSEDWSPSDLPAVSYIRVAPTTTDEAERAIERQRAQIALAVQRLDLRMADEFVDVGYSGMSMDRPDLRRLLDHVAAVRVGFCVVATTRDRLSEDPEDMADIDQALDDALVAIVVAADHIGPARDGR